MWTTNCTDVFFDYEGTSKEVGHFLIMVFGHADMHVPLDRCSGLDAGVAM